MVQTSRFRNRQPRRSLRTILASLFALFSFPPLLFVTGYSLMNFYRAIDSELVQRLRANVREVATTIGDYEAYLKARPARHRADPQLIFLISNSNLSGLRSYLDGSLRNSFLTTVSAFGRDGRLLSSYGRDENGSPTEVGPAADKDVYLQDSLLQPLQSSADATYIYGENGQMDLVSLTKLETKTGKVAGYIEEVIRVGPSFL